ncbi:MAG: autoinducer synthase [Alphaproteobacteria bacterium]|nr:MAG: autoinducer synthase [Alphaproteobacteria bacterium]
MIIIIDALNKHEFTGVLDEMFKLRARVFAGRLGWEVHVENGREIDQFDALDPAYVVGLDEEGHVISCVRALQTTGPHMLSDVFSAILDGEPPLRSARLWESTRFCVDTQRLGRGRGPNTVSHATCELMIGSLEFAMNSGIEDIVTVIDPVMDRVLKRSDCAPHGYVGKTVPMGKVPAMAALLDCTPERIGRIRAFAGIEHDVFATEEQLARLRDKPAAPAEQNVVSLSGARTRRAVENTGAEGSRIAEYLMEQVRDSATSSEYEAARALIDRLSKREEFRSLERLIERAQH